MNLVFVTKYRREVFTKEILDDLRPMFASVCMDFEAERVAFDGEDAPVRLLVNYPPKVCVSNRVNSLKGVSSRMIRKKNYPSIRKKLWAARYGRLPTMPVAAVAHPLPLSGSTSNSSKHHTRRTQPDGFAVRALDPALKGEVCRATDQRE